MFYVCGSVPDEVLALTVRCARVMYGDATVEHYPVKLDGLPVLVIAGEGADRKVLRRAIELGIPIAEVTKHERADD